MLKLSLSPFAGAALNWPGIPEWMARLLSARGVESAQAAQAFLDYYGSVDNGDASRQVVQRICAVMENQ